jgi:hypothetical protein
VGADSHNVEEVKPAHRPFINNHSLWATHDQACAVRYWDGAHAVYDCNTAVFHPSWDAQASGWRLVKADTWFKRFALWLAFQSGPREAK